MPSSSTTYVHDGCSCYSTSAAAIFAQSCSLTEGLRALLSHSMITMRLSPDQSISHVKHTLIQTRNHGQQVKHCYNIAYISPSNLYPMHPNPAPDHPHHSTDLTSFLESTQPHCARKQSAGAECKLGHPGPLSRHVLHVWHLREAQGRGRVELPFQRSWASTFGWAGLQAAGGLSHIVGC